MKADLNRYGPHGMLIFMAIADGWVMCRYSRAMPFVMTLKDWEKLPKSKPDNPA